LKFTHEGCVINVLVESFKLSENVTHAEGKSV